MELLWSLLVLIGLIGLFIGSYLLNKSTKKPEGCENLNAECGSCPIHTCINSRKSHEEDKI